MLRITPEEEADHALAIIWVLKSLGMTLNANEHGKIVWRFTEPPKGWPQEEVMVLLKSYKSSILFYLRRIGYVEPSEALMEQVQDIIEGSDN